MDKITDPNFYEELEFCKECPYSGEPNGCNREEEGTCAAYRIFVEAYGKLREYEHTGMTPSEIMTLRAERDNLIIRRELFGE